MSQLSPKETLEHSSNWLRQNFSASQWSFAMYTSFHAGLLAFVKEPMGIIAGAAFLFAVSAASTKAYQVKLQSNEKTVMRNEAAAGASVLTDEESAPRPWWASASKARWATLWGILLAEVVYAIKSMI